MDSLLGLLSRERDQKAFLHINEDDNKDDSSSSHRKYPLDSSLGAPFPASVFLAEDAQWELLKSFSIENKLSQLFLYKLFERFLSTKEAPLRQFRVLISDIKDRFLLSAAPFNELADLLIPHILLKSTYSGLMEAHSTTEISFTRLVITMFTFCHAPMPDLIFDFLAACRGNHNLSMNAYIYGFNFQQIILLFTENLPASFGVKDILRNHCFQDEEDKLTVRTVIQLGIKYPLLFLPLHAFVTRHLSRLLPSQGSTDPKRLKRTASGCYFFEGRTNGLTRDDFQQETASMLVADVVSGLHPRLVLSASKPGRIEVVTSEIWTMLKSALGYRSALALVMESKLSVCPSLSIAGHSNEDSPLAAKEELFYDVKQDRAFTYDVSTGRRAWTLRVKHQVLEEGAEDQSGKDLIFQLKTARELRGKPAPNFYYDR